jgi:ATP-dependent protease ClpP protease subunit
MKHKQSNNDIAKLFEQNDDIFEVFSTPETFVHRVTISKEFRHVEQFAQLVDILEQAGPDDIVVIRLASGGGSVEAILPLLSAMDNTEAIIHVHVDSDIASAATFILMKAHVVTFSRYVSVMLHAASWLYGGHSGNMEASTNHFMKTLKAMMNDLYKDFLTAQEFERLYNGLEIWLTPEECMERLKLRNMLRQDEKEESEDDSTEKAGLND